MDTPSPVSAATVVERALDDTIARLVRAGSDSTAKAMLVEARRLKSVTRTWHAIPPSTETRREMLTRVLHLASAAGSIEPSGATSSRPPPPTDPPESDPSSVSPPKGGFLVVRTEQMPWVAPLPGVQVKVLHQNNKTGVFTALVHLAAGTQLPARRQSSAEQVYIIHGSALVGDQEAHTGDYCRAQEGSQHAPLRTRDGCTLLLVGSGASDDEPDATPPSIPPT